ncbi:MAG TPA: hypothetical protein VEK57_01260 [Thermoanaerobaculia bacterium]|nr:hypothetical protein [Thermoanaerobaculia bacterium]
MGKSEERWAVIGKLLAGFGTAAVLVLTILQIRQMIGGPSVVAVFDDRYHVPSPRLRETLKDSISRQELATFVGADRDAKEAVRYISDIASRKVTDMDIAAVYGQTGVSCAWHVSIHNESDEVAKDVRLLVPGTGKYENLDCDCGTADISKPLQEWKDEIALGSIAPNGNVQLMLWPQGEPFRTKFNPGISHAQGSGVTRRLHGFYGWDSDLVDWFLNLPIEVRYSMPVIALLILGVTILSLIRRGYFVLRPHHAAVPPAIDETSQSAAINRPDASSRRSAPKSRR